MKRTASILPRLGMVAGIVLFASAAGADVSLPWGTMLSPASTTPGTTAPGGASAPATVPERSQPFAIDPDEGPNVTFEGLDEVLGAVDDATERVVEKVKGAKPDDDDDEPADDEDGK